MSYTDELEADSRLARDLRRMIDPNGTKGKYTVQTLVSDLLASKAEAWRQCDKMAAELTALRHKYEPPAPLPDLTLTAEWTKGT